jgi:hypothetical protein
MKDITLGLIGSSPAAAAAASGEASNGASGGDGELKQTLQKCGAKIGDLTNRVADKVRTSMGGRECTNSLSDSGIGFQRCLREMRGRLGEISSKMGKTAELDCKATKALKEKLSSLGQYVDQLERSGEADWAAIGQLSRQEARYQAFTVQTGRLCKPSRLSYEEKMQMYADRMAFEAVGQMAYLVQRQQFGGLYRDALLREVQGVNQLIMELERRLDLASKDLITDGSQEEGVGLVSTYAAMLAEKIVLEGQIASCAMATENQNTDDTAVLAALQVSESPSVLAMEVLLRSQVDSSISQQLQESADQMNIVSNHLVTHSLLQGEITHALQQVKRQFKSHSDSESMPELLRREREYSHQQLVTRQQWLSDTVRAFHVRAASALISAIASKQGQSRVSVDSVCVQLGELFKVHIDVFNEKHRTSDESTQKKCQHIITNLKSALDTAVLCIRDEYRQSSKQQANSYVNGDVSIQTLLTEFADISIQNAVISGTVTYVSDVYSKGGVFSVSGESPQVGTSSEGSSGRPEEGARELAEHLGQALLMEATNKQALSVEMRSGGRDPHDGSDSAADVIADLVNVTPDLDQFPVGTLGEFGSTLAREAVFQAQITYLRHKLKLQHERDMRNLKFKMESGQKVVLPSDGGKDSEQDIQAMLNVFEEILETKFEDECEVLSLLEHELTQLKGALSGATDGDAAGCGNCASLEQQIRSVENSFQMQLSVTQERHDVHLDVLRQEVSCLPL